MGGGPAGLSAAVYGGSKGLSVLLLARNATGDQAETSSRIENYLGFPDGISGDEPASRALKQATRFGTEVVMTRQVKLISRQSSRLSLKLDDDIRVDTKEVVLAMGVKWRKLEADGIDLLTGKGVLYGPQNRNSHRNREESLHCGRGKFRRTGRYVLLSYATSVNVLVLGPGIERSMSQCLIDQLAKSKHGDCFGPSIPRARRSRKGLGRLKFLEWGVPVDSSPLVAKGF